MELDAAEPIGDAVAIAAAEIIGDAVAAAAAEIVGEAVSSADPVGDAVSSSEPVGDAVAASEPFGDAFAAAEPVGDAVVAAEPFEDAVAAEPVGDAAVAAEPVGDSAATEPVGDAVAVGAVVSAAKRAREDDETSENVVSEDTNGASKKQKVKDVEEASVEGEGEKKCERLNLGSKVFESSVEMFEYFYKLLHAWPSDLKVNQYEHMVLLDLVKKGHVDSEKKIGAGIKAFLVREHPMWKSRCFFLERVDGNSDDFSFRKCINNIISLPENMKIKATEELPEIKGGFSSNKGYCRGWGGRGGGGRGGRGRGRKGSYRK